MPPTPRRSRRGGRRRPLRGARSARRARGTAPRSGRSPAVPGRSGRLASASARTSRGRNRLERWVSASRPDPGLAREHRRLAGGAVRGSRARGRAPRRGRWPRARAPPPRGAASRVPAQGSVSPVITTVRPGAGGAEHLVGAHRSPAGGRHLAAALEHPEVGALRHAERAGRVDVERPRAVLLDEGEADRRDRVAGRERAQLEALAAPGDRHLALVDLLQLQDEGRPADHRPQHLHRRASPRGPDEPQRPLAPPQAVRLQEPRAARGSGRRAGG